MSLKRLTIDKTLVLVSGLVVALAAAPETAARPDSQPWQPQYSHQRQHYPWQSYSAFRPGHRHRRRHGHGGRRRQNVSVYGYRQGETWSTPHSTRERTTWEGPTREDLRVDAEIEQAQIDYGPTHEHVAKLLWSHTRAYYGARNYKRADAMLSKIRELSGLSSSFENALPRDQLANLEGQVYQKVHGRPQMSRFWQRFPSAPSNTLYGRTAYSRTTGSGRATAAVPSTVARRAPRRSCSFKVFATRAFPPPQPASWQIYFNQGNRNASSATLLYTSGRSSFVRNY